MRRLAPILCFVSLLTDSCIEPIDITAIPLNPRIVVDALVTNDEGPYVVKLRYSQDTDAKSKDALPVSGANVSIIEDDQNVQILTEVTTGNYHTDSSWQAQIGKTYQLRFVTEAGKKYFSDPQRMTSPGTIDNIYVRFDPGGITFGDDGSLLQDAINVYIDARSASGSSGHLRWKFNGLFAARTYPELKFIELLSGVRIPDPPECSGYINFLDELVQVGECTCCECWPFDFNTSLSISEGQFTQPNVFKERLITKIPATSLRFINKYRIEVEQLSMTEEAYRFWKLVKVLQESGGSLFQPNAVKISGNVYSEDSDEVVLGLFAVSGVTRKNIFVDPSVVPYQLLPDERREECVTVFPNAFLEKPSYWP